MLPFQVIQLQTRPFMFKYVVLVNCFLLQNFSSNIAFASFNILFLSFFFSGHQNAHMRSDTLSTMLGTQIHNGIANENAVLMVVLRTRILYPDRPLFAPNDPCHSKSRRLLHHELQFPKIRVGEMYRLPAMSKTSSSRKFRRFR